MERIGLDFSEYRKTLEKRAENAPVRALSPEQEVALEVNLYLAPQPNWDFSVKGILMRYAHVYGEPTFRRKFNEYRDRHDGKGARYFIAMLRYKPKPRV